METKELWHKRTADTQMYATKRYKIKLQFWRIVDFLFFKTSLKVLTCWRVFLLRLFGAKIGKGCYISPRATILIPWNFEMGNFSSIDDYAYIKSSAKITIGDYVSIANFVHIIPGGHDVRSRAFTTNLQPVVFGHSVFIGADSSISKGVTIGQFSVIGARSVVLKDVPENSIAFGFPCKVHSERIPQEEYEKYRYHFETVK